MLYSFSDSWEVSTVLTWVSYVTINQRHCLLICYAIYKNRKEIGGPPRLFRYWAGMQGSDLCVGFPMLIFIFYRERITTSREIKSIEPQNCYLIEGLGKQKEDQEKTAAFLGQYFPESATWFHSLLFGGGVTSAHDFAQTTPYKGYFSIIWWISPATSWLLASSPFLDNLDFMYPFSLTFFNMTSTSHIYSDFQPT